MLRLYLIGLFLISLLSIGCLAAILIYTDPISANWTVFVLLYVSLVITCTGMLSLVGWAVRRASHKKISESVSFRYLEISARQGLLISLVLISVLMLQAHRVLEWWHIVGLLVLVGAAEWWLSEN